MTEWLYWRIPPIRWLVDDLCRGWFGATYPEMLVEFTLSYADALEESAIKAAQAYPVQAWVFGGDGARPDA